MGRKIQPEKTLYRNSAVFAGRMSLPEPLMDQARALLPDPAPARYGPLPRVGG